MRLTPTSGGGKQGAQFIELTQGIEAPAIAADIGLRAFTGKCHLPQGRIRNTDQLGRLAGGKAAQCLARSRRKQGFADRLQLRTDRRRMGADRLIDATLKGPRSPLWLAHALIFHHGKTPETAVYP